ncbi:hypothetical protein [Oricola thermophila]|uniref:Uncharacterized protein n=1 Tax=Oricola thermophila TaxID=2742145 RepID=A0A6N1VKV0_9HYPH|nr:hypothetical protein [Oricola thermophila]QKV20032.1 hypothetical protein HTY61_17035 [Oricola thermophila]
MADGSEVIHREIVYRIVPLDECLGLAESLALAGKRWHSHVLSPGCDFNPRPDRYALVIEDDTDDVTYLAYSHGFPEVDKELVKMLHGDDILDASATSGGDNPEVAASTLLPRLREIDAAGANWHHHMHFPDCTFNPHPGKWSISVEDGAGNAFSEVYDDEPVDVLREVEVIYFRRLDEKNAAG